MLHMCVTHPDGLFWVRVAAVPCSHVAGGATVVETEIKGRLVLLQKAELPELLCNQCNSLGRWRSFRSECRHLPGALSL